ncbi:hypothetical protein BDZ89DRAFT_956409 [Hymenopellis radicata]|nr:hypothetical protein BDZ89DRAFT_956409 [Hymenopellis radicata]
MKALRSNEPLSDVDVALFTRKIFSKAADNLSSLDDQISGLRASLDALTERRGRLQETLDHWRGVVSPMRTLPNEILTEIFMHVCRSFDVPQESDGPWLLCRVCTRWKALLLGTPALWAIFSLDAMRYGASPSPFPC